MRLEKISSAASNRFRFAALRAEIEIERRRRRVLVVGDSHAQVFRMRSWRHIPIRLDVVAVGGATLLGLDNPDSASGARRRFDVALRAGAESCRIEAVVTMLGEVDCGFLIWKRHQATGETVATLTETAVQRYESFIASAQRVAPVVVLSAPLPTLADQSAIGDYAFARRSITSTRFERTELVRAFNARCARMCDSVGASFVDLDSDSVGSVGEVSALLVGGDPTDHHYDRVVYAHLLQTRLAPVLGYRMSPLSFR